MEYKILTSGVDNVLTYSLLTNLFEHYMEKPKMLSDIGYIYENTNKYVDFFNKLLEFKDIQNEVLFSSSTKVFDIPKTYLPKTYLFSERDIINYNAQILKNLLNPLSTLKTVEFRINEEAL